MTTATTQRQPELTGQTVVVIGGSAGIGLESARRARAEGASVVLTGRNPDRLERAAAELGALSSAAFDATDPAALDRFFGDLPKPVDHVLVTGGGPYYAHLADLDRERAHRDFDEHLWLAVAVAQHAVGRVRPGGTLVFMGGTGGRGRGPGLSLIAAGTAALPALIANLAVEVAPIRVNLIAADAREQLRAAYQMLDAMGMEAFAEWARRELLATGEHARKRTVPAARIRPGHVSEPLAAQEAQVARLARDGLSNPEIGARLFISARTVQYHLGKVFTSSASAPTASSTASCPPNRTPPAALAPAKSARATAGCQRLQDLREQPERDAGARSVGEVGAQVAGQGLRVILPDRLVQPASGRTT